MQFLLKFYSACILSGYFIICFIPMLISLLLPLKWRLPLFVSHFWRGFGFITLRLCLFSPIHVFDKRGKNIKEKSPRISALYIANHSSFLDIPLILTQIQIPPLMKKEVLKMPFIGIYGIASGAIPVDRKDPSSRRKVREKLCHRMKKGLCVQYYPEGTRSRLGHPKPFNEIKTSLMRFAFDNNIPVVPVTMYNTQKLLDKKMNMSLGVPLGIEFSKEVLPEDFQDSDQFCQHCWSQIESTYQNFQTILGQ